MPALSNLNYQTPGHDVIMRVRVLVDVHGWSLNAIARASKINHSTVSKLYLGGYTKAPSFATTSAIMALNPTVDHRSPRQKAAAEKYKAAARRSLEQQNQLDGLGSASPAVDPQPPGADGWQVPEAIAHLAALYAHNADDEDGLPWTKEARCATVDAEIFFPEKGGSTREAKRVCRECPVRTQCLDYAVENDERFGIWGGMSERERRALRRGQVVI